MSQTQACQLVNESNDLYNRLYYHPTRNHFKYARILYRASVRLDRRMALALKLSGVN